MIKYQYNILLVLHNSKIISKMCQNNNKIPLNIDINHSIMVINVAFLNRIG